MGTHNGATSDDSSDLCSALSIVDTLSSMSSGPLQRGELEQATEPIAICPNDDIKRIAIW